MNYTIGGAKTREPLHGDLPEHRNMAVTAPPPPAGGRAAYATIPERTLQERESKGSAEEKMTGEEERLME